MLHFLLVTICANIIHLVQNYKIKLRLISFFKEKSQFNARQHKKSGMRHYYFLNQDKIILFLIISKEIHPMNRPNSSIQFHSEKDFNPNRSLDWYALMKPSFCHLFRRFSVTMEPHCALNAAKHLFKNKAIIIITLMTDSG